MSLIRVRRLDASWDPAYGNGRADYLTDIDAVAQIIRSRLLLFLDEWWEDQSDGLPMWQSILGVMGANKTIVDRLISARILTAPYVKGIKSYSSKLINRNYQCWVAVNTTFGTITITNVLPVQPPVFSFSSTSFVDLLPVDITSATPGAEIRYTIDGTTPTKQSLLYQGTIVITSTCDLAAMAFKYGMTDSKITRVHLVKQ